MPHPLRSLKPFAAAIALAAALPAQGKTEHPSLGVCTRQEEFARRQQAMDVKVQALAAATDAKAKQAATGALVAAAAADIECLIRYREPGLLPVFTALLAAEQPWHLRTRAAYALKMLADEAAVPALQQGLADADSMVREACASALGHIGGDAAIAALQQRLPLEQDPYVQASLRAMAQSATGHAYDRSDGNTWLEPLDGPEGATRVAFAWTVKGKNLFNDVAAKAVDVPAAERFVLPIQRYREDLFAGYPRNSFGGQKGHAGEDCAWFRDGCGIYAIADGVVRMVQGAGGDWGFLIAIEHRLPDGRYLTSVYGHCGFDVLVRAGDVVTCGQRIASQGLSCSVENGGYGGHLHFGLGDGPFRRPPGMAVGDQVNLDFGEGRKEQTPVLRIVYGQKTNSHGWPMCAFVVAMPDGKERTLEVPEQPAQKEVSWFQAYVKNCRGWLNPQVELPKLVGDAAAKTPAPASTPRK